jgi:hypothetical protein
MVRKQLRLQRAIEAAPGLRRELAMHSDEFRRAFLEANRAYAALGIRYALVGGLAAGAYGAPRVTRDIDFLVGSEAFVHRGPLIAFAVAMPLQAYSVAIDPIPLPEDETQAIALARSLTDPHMDVSLGVEVPMLDATALAYMKLATPRFKDLGDVVAMLLAGTIDRDQLREYVAADPSIEARYEAALEELNREDA